MILSRLVFFRHDDGGNRDISASYSFAHEMELRDMKLVDILVKIIDRLNWLMVRVAAAFLLFIMVVIMQGVVMRYVFASPQAFSV